MKVYGPYTRKDGRKHVILYDSKTGTRRTQSYPRYAMEQALGRKLNPEEHVDHIDNDCTNNDLSNFQLLSQTDNNIKSLDFFDKRAKGNYYQCYRPGCDKRIWVFDRTYKERYVVRKKHGPYCTKYCAGVDSHRIAGMAER